MANELIINASLPETRIALMEDGEIQELLIERASGKGIVGNIYKGRVTRVLPGMQAAFVDIGLEKAAFLYVDDVYVHSEIWKEEEDDANITTGSSLSEVHVVETEAACDPVGADSLEHQIQENKDPSNVDKAVESLEEAKHETDLKSVETTPTHEDILDSTEVHDWSDDSVEYDVDDEDDPHNEDPDSEDFRPQGMGVDPKVDQNNSEETLPQGTIAPTSPASEAEEVKVKQPEDASVSGSEGHAIVALSPNELVEDEPESEELEESADLENMNSEGTNSSRNKRHRRGRRGGRFRRKSQTPQNFDTPPQPQVPQYPENFQEQLADQGVLNSDRSTLEAEQAPSEVPASETPVAGRPEEAISKEGQVERRTVSPVENRSEFRAQRSRDRRIRQKASLRPSKPQINIQDLLKEGQEVLVQVAKDPIATKGARLTCHISLPGRHLVCMPTIDHVGVSRRIEREDERRRLREYVERSRPRNLGFIVRTASGRQQSEKRIKQDIEYLTRLWTEIREKASSVTAPSLVYEDLNAVLRAVRDWVTEEIDKVIVDSRYHYNEIVRFVSHFMPSLKHKVDLYHGDIPIFDAYGISTELSRALERKVWLKSGGYIVIDQAEALVAIDVNTGRYVGKKNLEDTILKTNLEAVQEVAYQLRLRNCGGIIIIDLIDMEKEENKHRVYRALEDALAKDRARPTILKISELGLIEMTRKRTRDTIVRTLCESCSHCEGKGFIKGKQTVAYEVMREIEREGIDREINKILVQAHPDVIDILAIDERESLDLLERRYRKQIYLQSIADFHPEQFEVSADKKERSDRTKEIQSRESSHYESNLERIRVRDRQRSETPRPKPLPQAITIKPKEEGKAVLETKQNVNLSANPSPSPSPNPSSEAAPQEVDGNTQIEFPLAAKVPLYPNPEDRNQTSSEKSSSELPVRGSDEFFDEEDRLAFLRAQAAQDAALARLNHGSGHSSVRNHENSNRNDRTGNNRRGARGRRNSKFRGRNDNRRGPKPFGYNGKNLQKWGEPQKDPSVNSTQADPNASSVTPATAAENSSGGGTSGEGGDHSQPPA